MLLAHKEVSWTDHPFSTRRLTSFFLVVFTKGADVISISIGGRAAWTEDAEAVVASRLVDAGVLLVSRSRDPSYALSREKKAQSSLPFWLFLECLRGKLW